MESGKWIQRARRAKGYSSQRKFAEAIGVSHTVIADWERGDKLPSDRTARLAAAKLGLEINELFRMLDDERFDLKVDKLMAQFPEFYGAGPGDEARRQILNRAISAKIIAGGTTDGLSEDASLVVAVHILNLVPGDDSDKAIPAAFETAKDFVYVDSRNVPNPDKTFALRVRGDSMTGDDIQEGDTIVLDARLKPLTGDIVVAVIDGEATLKKYRRTKDIVILEGAKAGIEPIILTEENSEGDYIVGVITQHIRHRR